MAVPESFSGELQGFLYFNGQPIAQVVTIKLNEAESLIRKPDGTVECIKHLDYSEGIMAFKKESQKVIDLGRVEVLAGCFIDPYNGQKYYWGDPEHIFQLRMTEEGSKILKSLKVKE